MRAWQRCATRPVTGCNWLVPAGRPAMCESCVLTRTRPADDDAEGMAELVRGEMAKRRLIFQLAELGLPVSPRDEAAGRGLAFDLLSSTATKVITGHDDGVITLDLAEADDEHRERLRQQLNEPYRTLLGHFRHEIGHYYWPILVDQPDVLDACRALFGDDRADYAAAIKQHYDDPDDGRRSWTSTHISRYATMHPYEDWAETFAHYLHILDTLQTARSFGLGTTDPSEGRGDTARPGGDASRPDGGRLVRRRDRPLARAVLRPQPDQPFHGPRRPVPLRAGPPGHPQARLRRPHRAPALSRRRAGAEPGRSRRPPFPPPATRGGRTPERPGGHGIAYGFALPSRRRSPLRRDRIEGRLDRRGHARIRGGTPGPRGPGPLGHHRDHAPVGPAGRRHRSGDLPGGLRTDGALPGPRPGPARRPAHR